MTYFLFFFVLLCFYQVSFTQSLTLDLSFGNNGYSIIPNTNENIVHAEIEPGNDGKIITSGATSNQNIILRKYSLNGDLDTSFGDNGFVITPLMYNSYPRRSNLKIQSDGKIIVIGSTQNTNFFSPVDFLIARYNSNGTLDNTFGEDGYAVVGTQYKEDGFSVELQADNKIIAIGIKEINQEDFYVARLNENGTLDLGFGKNGVVTISFTEYAALAYARASCVKILPSGKIIVAGTIDTNNFTSSFGMIRLNANGTLDSTLGVNVKRFTNFSWQDRLNSLVVNNFNIYLAGFSKPGFFDDYTSLIVRYNTNGNIDTSFGNNGYLNNILFNSDEITSKLMLLPNGKLLSFGQTYFNSTYQLLFSQLNQDGTIDPSFGNNGNFVMSLPGSTQSDPSSFIRLSDNEYIICASGYSSTNGLSFPVLAKYIDNGDLSMNEENIRTVNVSPNPFVNYIDINLKNVNNDNLSIELFDNNGRKIQTLLNEHVVQ